MLSQRVFVCMYETERIVQIFHNFPTVPIIYLYTLLLVWKHVWVVECICCTLLWLIISSSTSSVVVVYYHFEYFPPVHKTYVPLVRFACLLYTHTKTMVFLNNSWWCRFITYNNNDNNPSSPFIRYFMFESSRYFVLCRMCQLFLWYMVCVMCMFLSFKHQWSNSRLETSFDTEMNFYLKSWCVYMWKCMKGGCGQNI